MADEKEPAAAVEGAANPSAEGAPAPGVHADGEPLVDPNAAASDSAAPIGPPADGSAIAISVSNGDATDGAASPSAAAAAATAPAAAALAVAAGAIDPAYSDATVAGAPGSNNSLSKFIALAMTAQGSFTFKIVILCVVLSVLFASCYLNYWEIHLYFANYEDNKLCERPLGMWLYVSGISGFLGLSLSTAGSVVVVIAKRTRDQFKIKGGVALHCLNQLNNLFGFIWMIYGSVLVYAIDADTTLCPGSTYNFTWYFITSTWSVSGSVLVLAVAAAIATLCYRRYKGIGGTYEFDDTLTTNA